MKNSIIAVLILLFSCKKEENITPTNQLTYTPTNKQDTILVEYRVKTSISYLATYSIFGGFNSDGSVIMLSISDSLSGNDTIRFESITSPFGYKYHYQIFTLAQTPDSNTISIYINGDIKGGRPNYGSVFNFAYADY